MTEVDWEARLRAAVEETLRKRAARAQERAVLKARRGAGLELRHARKLRGNRGHQRGRGAETVVPQQNPGGDMPYPPPCCADVDEPPCPQHRQAQRVMRFEGPSRHGVPGTRVIGDSGKARPASPQEPTQD